MKNSNIDKIIKIVVGYSNDPLDDSHLIEDIEDILRNERSKGFVEGHRAGVEDERNKNKLVGIQLCSLK
jgi:hypothetical protein